MKNDVDKLVMIYNETVNISKTLSINYIDKTE